MNVKADVPWDPTLRKSCGEVGPRHKVLVDPRRKWKERGLFEGPQLAPDMILARALHNATDAKRRTHQFDSEHGLAHHVCIATQHIVATWWMLTTQPHRRARFPHQGNHVEGFRTRL